MNWIMPCCSLLGSEVWSYSEAISKERGDEIEAASSARRQSVGWTDRVLHQRRPVSKSSRLAINHHTWEILESILL